MNCRIYSSQQPRNYSHWQILQVQYIFCLEYHLLVSLSICIIFAVFLLSEQKYTQLYICVGATFSFLYIICCSQNNLSLVTATALAHTMTQKYLAVLKLKMCRIKMGALFLFCFYFELKHIYAHVYMQKSNMYTIQAKRVDLLYSAVIIVWVLILLQPY